MLALALTTAVACGTTEPATRPGGAEDPSSSPEVVPEPATAESDSPEPTTAPPAPPDLEDVDLGELRWTFRPGGNVPETRPITLSGGQAQQDGIRYTLGEPVLADVTGDGRVDAAAPLTALDGNAVDQQWYLWVATDDGPEQVVLPIARASGCGTAIESVRAVPGGIEVHEFRRAIGEDTTLPCSERGTDERIRTVTADRAGPNDVWWPLQTAPVGGHGGLCPVAAEFEGFLHRDPLHAAPRASAPEVTGGQQVTIFPVEPWPVYGSDFPEWVLVGVRAGDTFSCAWSRAG